MGQSEDHGIPFVAYWNMGDEYQFNVEKRLEQWKDGKITKNEVSRYKATFKIIDSTATSYIVHWSYNLDLGKDHGIDPSIVERSSKFNELEYQYRTDELGAFVELLNWEEVSNAMKDLVTQMIDAVGEDDLAKREKVQGMLEPMLPLFSSKDAIENLAMKEVQLIHYPFGVEFSTTDPLEYDEALPNLFGGDPIKARSKVSVSSVDRNEMRCVLQHQMSIDPKEMKKIMNQALQKLELNAKEMESGKYNVRDENTFDYLYETGVPVKIVADRETIMSFGKIDGKRIDRTSIELIQ
ncbi:MAG: hypothetical protein M3R08_10520 [Bacteroidota bacterium]|nr:hypothetical protein [Bacteroidota bacterium]